MNNIIPLICVQLPEDGGRTIADAAVLRAEGKGQKGDGSPEAHQQTVMSDDTRVQGARH